MPGAELILRNANVITMHPARPSAQAVAVGGGRIVAVGSDDEVGAWANGTCEVRDREIKVLQTLVDGRTVFEA